MNPSKSDKFIKAKIRINGALNSGDNPKLEKVLLGGIGAELNDSLHIIDEHKENDLLKLYFLLNSLSVNNVFKRFELYKQIIGHIANEQSFFENYEFYKLFSSILTKLKRDTRKLKDYDFEYIETNISELRRLFNPLRRAQFFRCLANVLSTLFFLYFKLQQFHQSSFLLPMISNMDKVLENSETIDRVCLCYYLARLAVLNDELYEAAEYLEKAMKISHKYVTRRKIMRFFVIIKLRLRIFPTYEALKHYKLDDYIDLVSSVRNGNYSLFEKTCLNNREKWMKLGIYYILGDLESLLIRNLVRRLHLLSKSRLIRLEVIQNSLNLNRQHSFCDTSVLNLLASLISRNIIDGKLKMKTQVLQLAKEDAFPI